jgi:hypothetical protein
MHQKQPPAKTTVLVDAGGEFSAAQTSRNKPAPVARRRAEVTIRFMLCILDIERRDFVAGFRRQHCHCLISISASAGVEPVRCRRILFPWPN